MQRAAAANEPRLLLVDDEHEVLEELSEGLDALGIPSRTASSAAEALEIVQRFPALDVVVTDLQMPQIDGIELLQKLAARRRARPLAAIVISGRAALDRAVAALRLHAVDFLQKPLTPEEVALAVRRAFSIVEDSGPQDTPMQSRPRYLEALIAARSDRQALFKTELFADPAWDMLLDLALSEASGRRISVTSLCIASGVPTTTALRRLDDLQAAGLIERMPDDRDRRRILVQLSDDGRQRMHAFLDRQAARIGIRLD
ncbi:response regulator [Segnochrobactrum spirostomi]|uniref:Response regulator n=1 Tax=Segnochrobactrum spirostomi TaxID=2608987 RepID=A0A6A7Y374_9HYPH|nr:response regulator [Segnochrobactrum spirostomi]MQT13513.1 response regulator [Segnochrobactrum spirostomi]